MKRTMLIALTLFFLAGASAQGQSTIFSNFGTDSPRWDLYMGYAIGKTITGGNYAIAVPFNVPSAQFLYALELPVWFDSSSGQPQGIIVSLNEDTPQPAGTMESFQYPGPFSTSGTSGETILFKSLRHPLLTEGKSYWIVAKTVDATLPTGHDTYVWNQNNAGGTGGCESYDRGEHWNCSTSWSAPAVNVGGIAGTVKPVVLVQVLIDDVLANLERTVAHSLVAKLSAVLTSLNSGRINAALGGLGAFVNAVNAGRGKRISADDADAMIAFAGSIAERIGTR